MWMDNPGVVWGGGWCGVERGHGRGKRRGEGWGWGVGLGSDKNHWEQMADKSGQDGPS